MTGGMGESLRAVSQMAETFCVGNIAGSHPIPSRCRLRGTSGLKVSGTRQGRDSYLGGLLIGTAAPQALAGGRSSPGEGITRRVLVGFPGLTSVPLRVVSGPRQGA
jgi:hypothetical protein